MGVTVPAYEYWNLMYATLTDKAAADFHTIPGLASSWKGSPDKKTWTYTLRPNLKWSDGQPLTSADVAFTINRARKESWLNYTSTVPNITATTPDPRTVVLKSSVADPKLPTMDVYILPKHVWSKYNAAAITKYNAKDGVGSGPFVLQSFQKGQFARLKANPNYWKGRPAIDQVIIRQFNNADAEVAALQRGQIDAIEDVPGGAFLRFKNDPNIETVSGEQGAFNELALNAGAGLKKPHPALLDIRGPPGDRPRHRQEDDRLPRPARPGHPRRRDQPFGAAGLDPQDPPPQRYDFNLAKANQILDARRLQGHQRRRDPRDARRRRPLRLTYKVRSESETAAPTAEFIKGWMRKIGIATTQKVQNDSQLTETIGKGDYDMFVWGWTPFIDPDPMLSYFTCGQVARIPRTRPTTTTTRTSAARRTTRSTSSSTSSWTDQAHLDSPSDAHDLLRVRALCRALPLPRPPGLPQGPLHRLDPPAREDRAGPVHQLLADLHQPEAGLGGLGRRRGWGPGR